MSVVWDRKKIRRMLSARHQLREACRFVGGQLMIDYDTKEVACILPNKKKIVALDDATVEVYDPEKGVEEFFGFIKIVPSIDRITIMSSDGRELDIKL